VRFRRHQRVGVAWLYLRGRGLIGDQVGTGKTAQAAGLLALCKQNGELDAGPALVVCRPSALMQWVDELNRYLPKLVTVAAVGDKRSRAALYGASFDVLVIGYQMLVNDLEQLVRADWAAVVVDDVDPLRHHANRTAYAVKRIARRRPGRARSFSDFAICAMAGGSVTRRSSRGSGGAYSGLIFARIIT